MQLLLLLLLLCLHVCMSHLLSRLLLRHPPLTQLLLLEHERGILRLLLVQLLVLLLMKLGRQQHLAHGAVVQMNGSM
jgi:hypothetical protein